MDTGCFLFNDWGNASNCYVWQSFANSTWIFSTSCKARSRIWGDGWFSIHSSAAKEHTEKPATLESLLSKPQFLRVARTCTFAVGFAGSSQSLCKNLVDCYLRNNSYISKNRFTLISPICIININARKILVHRPVHKVHFIPLELLLLNVSQNNTISYARPHLAPLSRPKRYLNFSWYHKTLDFQLRLSCIGRLAWTDSLAWITH